MDFLNQFPNTTIAKDDNSLFSFTDKVDQKGDLPFAFGTQSSEAGEINFLNQMKSQDPGESFALDNTQKNMEGLNFLKTIYEVPESSNNIFNSDGEGFPLHNPMSEPLGLDFIREGNEDNFNFEEFHNKQNSPNGNETINVDINNLFKNSASPVNDNSKANSKNNIDIIKADNILPINSNNPSVKINSGNTLNVNIRSSGKKGENVKAMNNNENIINMNNNKIASFPKVINNQNKNINITPETRSNPTVNQKQSRPNNTSIIFLNKNKSNGDNMNNNNNNNMQDTSNIPPQFQNISIKPQAIKEQKNSLDDIDKMISLNLQQKPENKQGNKNINIPNEISDIFSPSTIIGKRSSIEPNDKDLQNIDNLLNFTKEPIPPYNPLINKQKPLMMNPSINNNNTNSQFIKKKTQNTNNVMIKPLPGDSFDKKTQVIKLTKEDKNILSQIDTNNKNKNDAPSKLEMVKKYNDLVVRLNKIREQAKEYRNLGNYFSLLISANENYESVYPGVIKGFLEEYNNMSEMLLKFVKIKNNKMNEMSNEFDEEVKKYSLAFPEHV